MKITALCTAMFLVFAASALGQGTYKPLYKFGAYPGDGLNPKTGVIADADGNLYGTTLYGGASNCGTVFKFSKDSSGKWSETVLYSFSCYVEADPSGLVLDARGDLFGATFFGGVSGCAQGYGCGLIYELSHPNQPGGMWTYSVLYTFCSVDPTCLGGGAPNGPLVFDGYGNLYGTTAYYGANGWGTVFELSPGAAGWTETVLYNFCSVKNGQDCLDGAAPGWGVTFDHEGNLYGTTDMGGQNTFGGVLFRLSPTSTGWTETVLATCDVADLGDTFLGPVTIDSNGNLYTTFAALRGDTFTKGAVTRLDDEGSLKFFDFNGTDGQGPTGGVIVDEKRGTLFGTTVEGPTFRHAAGGGGIYSIDSSGTETFYTICARGNCASGASPMGPLFEDGSGNLFGTTEFGGLPIDGGVIFAFTPDP